MSQKSKFWGVLRVSSVAFLTLFSIIAVPCTAHASAYSVALPKSILKAASSPDSDLTPSDPNDESNAAYDEVPTEPSPEHDDSSDTGSMDPDWIDFEAASAPISWSGFFTTKALRYVKFGVLLTSPQTVDRGFYSLNADFPMAPASNSKLFTTAAALHYLGQDFRFETKVNWKRFGKEASEMSVTVSGDPTYGLFKDQGVEKLADEIRNQGIDVIKGKILVKVADMRWSKMKWPQGWEVKDDVTSCYGVLVQPINMDLNCAIFTIDSASKGHWTNGKITFPVAVKLARGKYSSLRVTPVYDANQYPSGFAVTGYIGTRAINKKAKTGSTGLALALPVYESRAWFLNDLKEKLTERGIRFESEQEVTIAASFFSKSETLTHYSPPLNEVIKPFMKDSLNIIGETLLMKIGEKEGKSGQNLTEAGAQALAKYLDSLRTNAGTDKIKLYDGSGLSRDSRVTARFIHGFLEAQKREAFFPALWESLPIAGVDGTLEERMIGTKAHGVLRAKTGTLTGSYNLSGYVPRIRAGQIESYSSFVMLATSKGSSKVKARHAQDLAGAKLAEILNK